MAFDQEETYGPMTCGPSASVHNSIVIKAQLNEDLRRFNIALPLTWDALSYRIAELFLLDRSAIIVKYKDEEGDLITISSNTEVNEALVMTGNYNKIEGRILRVYIFAKQHSPAPITPPSSTTNGNGWATDSKRAIKDRKRALKEEKRADKKFKKEWKQQGKSNRSPQQQHHHQSNLPTVVIPPPQGFASVPQHQHQQHHHVQQQQHHQHPVPVPLVDSWRDQKRAWLSTQQQQQLQQPQQQQYAHFAPQQPYYPQQPVQQQHQQQHHHQQHHQQHGLTHQQQQQFAQRGAQSADQQQQQQQHWRRNHHNANGHNNNQSNNATAAPTSADASSSKAAWRLQKRAEKIAKQQQQNRQQQHNLVTRNLCARFVRHVSISDGTELRPNTPFVKTWRFRNEGPFPWPAGCFLLFISKLNGDRMSGPESVTIGQTESGSNGVEVGQEIEVSVDLVAPQQEGRYVGFWRLCSPSGRKFGQRVWVKIDVVSAPQQQQTPTPTPTPIPTPTAKAMQSSAGMILSHWGLDDSDVLIKHDPSLLKSTTGVSSSAKSRFYDYPSPEMELAVAQFFEG